MLNKSNIKCIKLSSILIKNNKLFFLISLLFTIIGFTFFLAISSLSQTIINTRQTQATDTYGKFLMVVSDLNSNQIESIKKLDKKYDFSFFEILGTVKYKNNSITMGNLKEEQGTDLGIKLINGKWPSKSNEIVIEEYLKSVFHIKLQTLPSTISLKLNGEEKKYTITGIISNYSSMLSVADDLTIDTNVYPSIISSNKLSKNRNKSSIIKQHKINYSQLNNDIDNVYTALDNISNNININDNLYSKAYLDNKDIINLKTAYQFILNILLILAQIIIWRYFLLKNVNTLDLFHSLGLTKCQINILIILLIDISILFSIIISCINTLIIGNIFINHIFKDYSTYYIPLLIKYLLIECISFILIISIIYNIISKIPQSKDQSKFKKIDPSIIFIQLISMFFIIATINFSTMFKIEDKNISYDIYSKVSVASQPLQGYSIPELNRKYFDFNSITPFKKFEKYLNMKMSIYKRTKNGK